MKLVIDACVFVAEQIEEQPEHRDAALLLEQCVRKGIRIFAPAIVLAEVAGAITRITCDSALGSVSVTRLSHFSRLTYRQVDLDFAEAAARLAARHSFRGADAHYAALARELRCPLITNDEELLRRCPTTMVTQTPAQWLALHRSVD